MWTRSMKHFQCSFSLCLSVSVSTPDWRFLVYWDVNLKCDTKPSNKDSRNAVSTGRHILFIYSFLKYTVVNFILLNMTGTNIPALFSSIWVSGFHFFLLSCFFFYIFTSIYRPSTYFTKKKWPITIHIIVSISSL